MVTGPLLARENPYKTFIRSADMHAVGRKIRELAEAKNADELIILLTAVRDAAYDLGGKDALYLAEHSEVRS